MQIVIIGSGNTATILGKKFLAAGHDILQVYGRNEKTASQLASVLQTNYTTTPDQINTKAGLYVLAVPDDAIPLIAESLPPVKGMIVHTAGSVPILALANAGKNYGILYPLQSLHKEMTELPEIPFLVDGNTNDDRTLIADFARGLSGQVQVAGDQERLQLHLAAVMVSNFTNHLYALAEQYCLQEKLDFKLLLPLITSIASRLYSFSPREVQTGPGIRHDEQTIQKHLELLDQHPSLKELYTLFTKSIQNMYGETPKV